jgi:hypothetical protein
LELPTQFSNTNPVLSIFSNPNKPPIMYTITILLVTLLTILSLTNATSIPNITPAGNPTSIRMILNNNCPFDVYVRQGIAAEPGSRKGQGEDCGDWSGKDTPEVKIGKGDKYVTPVPIIKNTCGHSGKLTCE